MTALALLTFRRGPWGEMDLAQAVFDISHRPSAAQSDTVRRSLTTLQRANLVQVIADGRVTLWAATEAGRRRCHRWLRRQGSLPKLKRMIENEQMHRIFKVIFDPVLKRHELRVELARTLKKLASPIDSVALEAARQAERVRTQLGEEWEKSRGRLNRAFPSTARLRRLSSGLDHPLRIIVTRPD
jgi:hypothetical protein